jgi:thiosulfate/3-mercaptopyruvate sulfurtransferase
MSDHSSVLIETQELESKLGDASLRIVEVDEDTSLYEKGHIPGAIAWNWKKDLHDTPRREFIDEAGLAALLDRSGVGSAETVVLYSGNNNWFASYAYWLLKYRGFDAVKILNGGRKKWELESRELSQELPSIKYPAGKPTISGTRPELRALRDEVLSAAPAGQTTFIDVRSPEEYRGELLAPPHLPQEQAQVPGHIPNAANVPWSKAANEDGSFKSDSELQELYGGVGVSPDKSTIAYCRIGERSSHTWFVLHELLGYSDVKNYDGSWTEYGSLVGVPVEK